MALSKVIISIANGALGGVSRLSDGIAGLIVSGAVAPSYGWPLGTAKAFYSIEDVKGAGLTSAYDTTNSTHAYRQVAEFYSVAGDGAKCWIMVIPPTESMEDICDGTSDNAYAKKLLKDAGGEIRLLGITRKPGVAYTPAVTKGIDDDVIGALAKAQLLAEEQATKMAPVVILVEGRAYQGDTADLQDLKGFGYNRVGAVIVSTEAAVTNNVHDKSAAVGLLLGTLAKLPVMRKAGRVKNGATPVVTAYFSDGSLFDNDVADSIDDKGWITFAQYPRRSGYYWGNDNLATDAADDYNSIVNRRVIDKAMLVAYDTFVGELNDEVEVDDEGRLAPGVVASHEGKIKNALDLQMYSPSVGKKEISGRSVFIDPEQNILSSGIEYVVIKLTPMGYNKEIGVTLGFENPALAQ
jgi:hypothetical protein